MVAFAVVGMGATWWLYINVVKKGIPLLNDTLPDDGIGMVIKFFIFSYSFLLSIPALAFILINGLVKNKRNEKLRDEYGITEKGGVYHHENGLVEKAVKIHQQQLAKYLASAPEITDAESLYNHFNKMTN